MLLSRSEAHFSLVCILSKNICGCNPHFSGTPYIRTLVLERFYNYTNGCNNGTNNYLMLVPCMIRRNRNNQHNEQISNTAFSYMLFPTCFGSSLPSSGSVWIRLSYVKIQIDMVVYLKYITDNNQCVKHLV
jgi:hypothetical protein